MSRYIDMDAVICDLHTAPNNLRWDMEDIEFWIESQPTVDVVEVVRCRDCKHYTYKHSLPNVKNCTTKHCTRSAHIYTKPTDFCSYGERGDLE